MIYERIIRPFILKHKEAIDKRLNQAADVASDLMNEGQYWSLLVYVVLVQHLVKSFHNTNYALLPDSRDVMKR